MHRKQTLLAALLLTVSTLAYLGLASRQPLSAQAASGVQQNNHVQTLRTIPKEFGRVIGTVTDHRDQHSLVMEAADGTIRAVPFDRAHAVSVFTRE